MQFRAWENITFGFHSEYKFPSGAPLRSFSTLVHNTFSRKPIIAHRLVHVNHWNITSGTGSYTLPVYFDQPVHPITLQLKTTLEKTLRCQVSLFYFWYRYFNSRENPRTKRSLFAALNRILEKNLKTKKKSLVLKWPEKNFLQDTLKTSISIFEFWNFLFQIVNEMAVNLSSIIFKSNNILACSAFKYSGSVRQGTLIHRAFESIRCPYETLRV
jgi:hypothetical protein